MNRLELQMLYKAETSNVAVEEVETEFEVWRSRGQWVINMSDAEKLNLAGSGGLIQFTKPDTEYVRWLEEKVMELLK